MKAKDLRERSPEDLRELEKSIAKDIFQNRFKNFTNRLDDTSAIKKTRRDLARVKTLLVQKSVGQADQPVASTSGSGSGEAPAAAKIAKPVAAKKAPKAEVKAASGASAAKAEKPAAAEKPAKKTAKKTSAKGEAK
jgi:large subunit ribosomal protein L29